VAEGSVERLFVPLADGTRLAATLYLPATDGAAPCVLEALPYRKDDLTASYRPEYVRLRDEHGYAVARVDLRGTGSSDGVATDEYPAQEQRDLCEVIAWLAGQPWCSGAVGMYGTSYSGFNALQVACERPPALKAICAIYATDDRWTDDVHYMGGALRLLDVVDYPAYMVAMNALPPVPSLAGDGWKQAWRERVESVEPWLLRWVEEQRDSAYWRHGSLRPAYDRIACPTMLVGGWADGYRNNTFRTVQALREAGTPHRLLLGPWSHMSTATSLPGPHVDLVPVMARWWDRWLRGIDNGVDAEPALTWFAQTSTRPGAARRSVEGEWRCAPSWPLEGAAEDVRALGEGVVTYAVEPDVGTAAWNSCAGVLPWGQPTDQRADDARSLTWEWPADGLSLLGHPRVELRVASTEPVASVSVKLCDVWPDGSSALLSRGLLNLTHRSSSTDPSPLPVGEPVDVVVELEAMSWDAAPGHRLRLSLAGVDWPNTVAPPRPVTLSVDRAASRLVLPVAGRSSPAGLAVTVHEPEDDPAEGVSWTVTRDVLGHRTVCSVEHGATDEAELASTVEHYTGSVSVDTITFAQRATAEADFTVRWEDATVRATAEVTMDAGPSAYDVEVTVRTWSDGEPFADRQWSRSIPRDLG
jgi:putative CocE/NonD family hydrolase